MSALFLLQKREKGKPGLKKWENLRRKKKKKKECGSNEPMQTSRESFLTPLDNTSNLLL